MPRNFPKILVEGGFFFGKIIGKINIVVLLPEEEFLVKNHKSRIINLRIIRFASLPKKELLVALLISHCASLRSPAVGSPPLPLPKRRAERRSWSLLWTSWKR
jgi:hypothetical protein